MENPPPIEVNIPSPTPVPVVPEVQTPTPAPSPNPEPISSKGFFSENKLEIAQVIVLGIIAASFITQIYFYRKKIMEESDFNKFENRIKNLEDKVLV